MNDEAQTDRRDAIVKKRFQLGMLGLMAAVALCAIIARAGVSIRKPT